jgi:phosphopantothenoylcysteine decarboxylase/phosphopantothenate--cysteine ligase
MGKNKKIVLGVTGSIAAYKAAPIIRKLRQKGVAVTAVMTKEAEHFITPLTLSTMSSQRVYCDFFDATLDPWRVLHIDLAQNTDAVLIAPATANIIGKIANGIADDLLTCLVMATRAPIIIAPAMHEHMYTNKIVQENCGKLKKNGVLFVGPIEGQLACGASGIGHLADEDDIVKAVLNAIK